MAQFAKVRRKRPTNDTYRRDLRKRPANAELSNLAQFAKDSCNVLLPSEISREQTLENEINNVKLFSTIFTQLCSNSGNAKEYVYIYRYIDIQI